jgi:hypothetical protein
MALADAADRGVAAHLAQRLDVVREQQGLATHAGAAARAASVPAWPPPTTMTSKQEPPLDNWGIRGGQPASEVDLGFNLQV